MADNQIILDGERLAFFRQHSVFVDNLVDIEDGPLILQKETLGNLVSDSLWKGMRCIFLESKLDTEEDRALLAMKLRRSFSFLMHLFQSGQTINQAQEERERRLDADTYFTFAEECGVSPQNFEEIINYPQFSGGRRKVRKTRKVKRRN